MFCHLSLSRPVFNLNRLRVEEIARMSDIVDAERPQATHQEIERVTRNEGDQRIVQPTNQIDAILDLAAEVYAGLDEDEIAAIEQLV